MTLAVSMDSMFFSIFRVTREEEELINIFVLKL